MPETAEVTRRLWSLCSHLRDEGVSYQGYLDELTQLLFLKLANVLGIEDRLPPDTRWERLIATTPIDLISTYRHDLLLLSRSEDPVVRTIFSDADTQIATSSSLSKIVNGIEATPWHEIGFEGLGNIYEGLIDKGAQESRYGAGQYFTPRAVIEALTEVISPTDADTIYDPAAGTGGFLVSAGLFSKRTSSQPKLEGTELVAQVRRLALMNLTIHGLDAHLLHKDALEPKTPKNKYSVCLTNPPFGIRGNLTEAQARELHFPTNNKQLAFLQHVQQALQPGGRAAVVVPDNVLFEGGVAAAVRRYLLENCNLHTILHLPPGIFYSTGIKTSVLFFEKGSSTIDTWSYDLRSDSRTFGKRSPLTVADFSDFIDKYRTPKARREATLRFQAKSLADIEADGYRLDLRPITYKRSESYSVEQLLVELAENLTSAQSAIQSIDDVLRPYIMKRSNGQDLDDLND